jgi:hypothetical protein
MRGDARAGIVERLLRSFGRSIADRLDIVPLRGGGPGLFEILGVSLLSARRPDPLSGPRAWLALRERGWATAEGLALSPWKGRVRALNGSGFTRSPERMSLLLGAIAEAVLERYEGDLALLRARAGRDPGAERRLLSDMRGVSGAVVDLFCREAQVVWDELFPFADEHAIAAAERLGLPSQPHDLAQLSGRERFPRLAAALSHVARVDAFHLFEGAAATRVVEPREPLARSFR